MLISAHWGFPLCKTEGLPAPCLSASQLLEAQPWGKERMWVEASWLRICISEHVSSKVFHVSVCPTEIFSNETGLLLHAKVFSQVTPKKASFRT